MLSGFNDGRVYLQCLMCTGHATMPDMKLVKMLAYGPMRTHPYTPEEETVRAAERMTKLLPTDQSLDSVLYNLPQKPKEQRVEARR